MNDDHTQDPQTDDTTQPQHDDQAIPTEEPATMGGDMSEFERLQNEANEMKALAQRTLADLQNFKRRADEQRAELSIFANIKFLEAIFPVIDNFKRAFDHVPEEIKDNEWVKGVSSIEKNFMDTLSSLGLAEINCEAGTKFDPNLHEALMQGPGAKDTVVECFEKGYQFKDKVVRPAKVKVGDGS
jgi:molecular chaperone GrpE